MGRPNFWDSWYGTWDFIGFLAGLLLPLLIIAVVFGAVAVAVTWLMFRFK